MEKCRVCISAAIISASNGLYVALSQHLGWVACLFVSLWELELRVHGSSAAGSGTFDLPGLITGPFNETLGPMALQNGDARLS